MLFAYQAPSDNTLLSALPIDEISRMFRGLDVMQVNLGDVLYEPGDPIRNLYFPNDCLVALLAVTRENMTLEVGLVGRDGVVGNSAAPNNGISQVRAIVQRSGTATRLSVAHMKEGLPHYVSLQRALNKNTQLLLLQAIQTAVCSRFHLLEARLARALLLTRDRLMSDQFHLTHEFLAQALGARRAGVTKAACTLQHQGHIRYSRGDITIVNGIGLEAASCTCYQVVNDIIGHSQ